jgi:hypothetical protein
MEKFQNSVDVIEHSGGSIGHDPGVLKQLADERGIVIANLSNANGIRLNKEVQEHYLAVAFLLSSNRGRYGRLLEDLENDYLQGSLPEDTHRRFQPSHKLEAIHYSKLAHTQRWGVIPQY